MEGLVSDLHVFDLESVYSNNCIKDRTVGINSFGKAQNRNQDPITSLS
jgi:hypothetical protein